MTARIAVFTCFLVVGICLAEPHLGAGNRAEHISACGLRVPREYREAQFTSVYKFDVLEGGKPTNIRRVQNEFLRDEEAAHCIATWRLPSISGEGTAEFS